MVRPVRVAVLDCDDSAKWAGMTLPLIEAMLRRTPDDVFEVFHAARSQFPPLEDVMQGRYDAIILGGSLYSAYDDRPFIKRLGELLPLYVEFGVRLLGVCFGHQMTAQALGGKVGKNPSGRFVLKVEDVVFDLEALRRHGLHLPSPEGAGQAAGSGAEEEEEQGAQQGAGVSVAAGAPASSGDESAGSAAAGAGAPLRERRVKLIESHGDQVLALPKGAEVLASSDTAAVEMWGLPGKVLCMQFHPEIDQPVVLEKIHSALSASGRLNPDEAAASERSLRLEVHTPQPVHALMREFLEGAAAARAAGAGASQEQPAVAAGAGGGGRGAGEAAGAPVGGVPRGEMAAELDQLVTSLREGFRAGLLQGDLAWEQLAALNGVAAEHCGRMAEHAQALGSFSEKLSEKQQGAQAALDALPQLEAQLDGLMAAADELDTHSRELERELGIKDAASPGGLFRWQ